MITYLPAPRAALRFASDASGVRSDSTFLSGPALTVFARLVTLQVRVRLALRSIPSSVPRDRARLVSPIRVLCARAGQVSPSQFRPGRRSGRPTSKGVLSVAKQS